MAQALLVSPAWLMGYDVPMVSGNETIEVNESFDTSRIVMDEQAKRHVKLYMKLSKEDRAKVDEYAEMLADKARDAAQDSASSKAAENEIA